MVVDVLYAQWLKAEALFALATVAGAVTTWGDKALDSSVISALANSADAATEAAAQASFLAGPLAVDKAVVKGQRQDLVGQVITITGDRLGYETGGGKVVFALGAVENDNGTTTLTILRRLA